MFSGLFVYISNLFLHSCFRPLSTERPALPSAPSIEENNDHQALLTRRARALYDYDAADESELSLLADEVCYG